MDGIYSSNLSDYGYDQDRGWCVPASLKAKPAAKAEPVAEAKPAEKNYCQSTELIPELSFWAEWNESSARVDQFLNQRVTPYIESAALAPTGCGGGSSSGSNVCRASGSPTYPDASINPIPTLMVFNPKDIKAGGKGVDATWQFNIANCDGHSKNMKVRVYFSADKTIFGDYTPDENGLVTVTRHFAPGEFPSDNPLFGDLYYYNPESSEMPPPLLKAIKLYLPTPDTTPTQYHGCDYSTTPPQPIVISEAGDSVGFGQSARIKTSPEACNFSPAVNQSDFNVDFNIEGKWLVLEQNNAAAIKFDNGTYYVDHNFTTTGAQGVRVKVGDAVRGGDPVESQPISIYVTPPDSAVDVFPSSSDGSFMALRPITLDAGFNFSVPVGNVNFAWAIKDPLGNPVTPTPASGKQVSFTPAMAGLYSYTLTITGDSIKRPIVKPGTVTINTFSKPDATIIGEQYPASGVPVYYHTQFISKYRSLGAEDDGAICTYTLSHTDPTTNVPTVDINKDARNCGDTLTVTYPTVSKETHYLLEAGVVGANQSYVATKASLQITINSQEVNQSGAAFSITYDDLGAVPFRQITLNGILAGAPEGMNLTYKWTITDNNDVPLSVQPGDGKTSTYPFTADGIYKVKLSVYGDDLTKPLSTKEIPVTMFGFPKPGVKLVINGNKPVYAGKPVPLTVLLGRTALPEDDSALYALKISHREYDPTTGLTKPVIDLDPTNPVAQHRDLIYTFPTSQTYQVDATVTGMNGGTVAYVDQANPSVFADVFSSITTPAISGPQVGDQGVSMTFIVANPDPNLDYTFDFGDTLINSDGGVQPDGGTQLNSGTTVDHLFTRPGMFPVKVTATSKTDPSASATSQPWNVTINQTGIVPKTDPIPNLVITPGQGPAPLTVTADASKSYVTADGATIVDYTFIWGDNNSPDGGPQLDSGAQPTRTHQFECTGASCTYTVKMIITDSNGKKASTTTVVSTWQGS
jgi:hypothetical protein